MTTVAIKEEMVNIKPEIINGQEADVEEEEVKEEMATIKAKTIVGGGQDAEAEEEEAEEEEVEEEVGDKRKRGEEERDKHGRIVRECGIDGCSHKTLNKGHMRHHKAKEHKIGEYVGKIPDDGKERDKWGNIIRTCGVDGCAYKTGDKTDMKKHKARKHKQAPPSRQIIRIKTQKIVTALPLYLYCLLHYATIRYYKRQAS